MTSNGDRVLIVGAGPTGLVMANELLRHGVPVRIVDENAHRSDKSKALGVQSRSLEIWESVGVVQQALAAGRKLHGANLYSAGRRIVHVGFDDIDAPYPFTLSLPQSETERILEEHLESRGVSVERNTRLVAVGDDGHAAIAELVRGDGTNERVHTRWILACDGCRSTVRTLCDVPFEGLRYSEAFVLGDVAIDWALPDDEVHAFFSPDGPIGALPLPGASRWRIVAAVGQSAASAEHGLDASSPPPSVESLEIMLRSRSGLPLSVHDAVWTSGFRIHRRIIPSYRKERVFFAGDAAHIHSPVGGQGMNTGMQDAFNLAWKIAWVHHGLAKDELLDSYSIERRPIAEATLQGTDMATRVVSLRNSVAREVRDHVAGFLASLEPVQKRLTYAAAELSLHYRKSPIVAEHRVPMAKSSIIADRRTEAPSMSDWLDFGGGPSPGDRAPDVDLRGENGPKRFFELFRSTKHALLLFDGAAATDEGYKNLSAIARVVAERHGRAVETHVVVPSESRPDALDAGLSVVFDPHRAAHRRYGAGSECLYLVRPDGYVAYRSQPAVLDALMQYLARILV